MAYAKVVNGPHSWRSRLRSLAEKLQSRLKLRSGKTYILPTGFGLAFAILSFILLAMAIGFGNNILYFFVFLLISMGLTTAVVTNKNIENLKPLRLETCDLFANEENKISIHFKSSSEPWSSYEVMASAPGIVQKNISEVKSRDTVELLWTPSHRGLTALPQLQFESTFPFRMLRAWKFFSSAQQVVIFPQRKGVSHIPEQGGGEGRGEDQKKSFTEADQGHGSNSGGGASPESGNEGLFRDFREHQRTDSPSRIDWRRSLRLQKSVVKNYEKGGGRKLLIDWDQTAFLPDFEDRISQLALWLWLSEEKREMYSLKIKTVQTEFFCGQEHLRLCLRKLALLRESDLI